MKTRVVPILSVLACAFFLTSAAPRTLAGKEPPQPRTESFSPRLRELLYRLDNNPGSMDQRAVDETVQAIHNEVGRQDPKVFVPYAIGRLNLLAPKDCQTRILIQRAMEKGWLEEYQARSFLVQADDPPEPHIRAMIKGLKSPDRKVRFNAIQALQLCGLPAAPALPKLRLLAGRVDGTKGDTFRPNMPWEEQPEIIVVQTAIKIIEKAIHERRKLVLHLQLGEGKHQGFMKVYLENPSDKILVLHDYYLPPFNPFSSLEVFIDGKQAVMISAGALSGGPECEKVLPPKSCMLLGAISVPAAIRLAEGRGYDPDQHVLPGEPQPSGWVPSFPIEPGEHEITVQIRSPFLVKDLGETPAATIRVKVPNEG